MKIVKRLIKKALSLIGLSKKLNPKSNTVIHGFKAKNGPGKYSPRIVFHKEENPKEILCGIELPMEQEIIFDEQQAEVHYWLSGKGLAAYVQGAGVPLDDVKSVVFFDSNSQQKTHVKVRLFKDSYIRLTTLRERAPVTELVKI